MGEPNPSVREVYLFGELRLDVASRRLERRGEAVSVPPKAFELLHYLVRNADRAVTRTELLDAVWRDTIVEEGNLGWNMSVLRKALDDGEGKLIETVRGYGYRLAVPVRQVSARPATLAVPEPREERPPVPVDPGSAPVLEPTLFSAPAPAPAPVTSPTSAPPAVRPRRVRLATFVAVLVAVALAVAIFQLRKSPTGEEDRAAAVAPTSADLRPALAVLPFENLSQRAETVWLATALAEMLNGELASGGRARTTPGESVAQVTAGLGIRAGSGLSPVTLARLRRDLGIDLVVVGNYLLLGDGDGLRVDYRLQSVSDGRTLFAGSENGHLAALFDLVGRTGSALRGGIPASEVKAVAAATPPASFRAPIEALQPYAEGIDLRRRFQLLEARKKFEASIAAAPDFALAHAALADVLAELGYLRDARAESRQALAGSGALSPSERLAIEARNRELEGRWSEAAANWRELVKIDAAPIENQLALARALARAGSHDEARASLDALARRPPPAGSDPRIELERGWAERYAQNFAAMRAAGARAVEAGRKLSSDYVVNEGLSIVGWADLSLGNLESALTECGEGQAIAERLGHGRLQALHLGICAWSKANLGRADEAMRDFEAYSRMAERDGNISYQSGATVAIGWQHEGRGELAVAGDFAARALALAASVDDDERELNSLELVSHVAFLRAELERAEEASVEALAKSRELNIASRISLHLGALGRIRLERGDPQAALAAHEEALRIFPQLAPSRIAARELDLAESRLETGDAAGAAEIAKRSAERLAGAEMPNNALLLATAIRGRAELRLGQTAPARDAAALLDKHAAELGPGPAEAGVLAERAELLGELGERERAAAAWRRLADRSSNRELELFRLTAEIRLAELDAAAAPGGTTTRLEAARRAARAARMGRLLGEKL